MLALPPLRQARLAVWGQLHVPDQDAESVRRPLPQPSALAIQTTADPAAQAGLADQILWELLGMTATAQRRPITSHPAFAPLIALWAAAVLGLTIAVLPAAVLERWLAAVGMGELAPLTPSLRAAVGVTAAVLGGLLGHAVTRRLVGDAGRDPRPIYSEIDGDHGDEAQDKPVRRRPLHVREELADGLGDDSQLRTPPPQGELPESPSPILAQRDAPEGFMILTPQPVHPPRPAPDLEGLLEQFDTAFAAFQDREKQRSPLAGQASADQVQAFVAKQTGPKNLPSTPSPIGGLVPDHQAELRAALDKLSRSQRQV